jgi:hypothetical protein
VKLREGRIFVTADDAFPRSGRCTINDALDEEINTIEDEMNMARCRSPSCVPYHVELVYGFGKRSSQTM